ncbi:toxin-antitoxin system YwqK family antitoxin [Xanthomarina sp. F2636L]|uniref:toxin-antitoxin system YwqK family antitoxin n=1 Tax=Xanthomarina sp. F2636L TaxID=2996018 RepID=UPI00225E29BA|nr:nicotinic acid mononucleotide adenyltransferase [Xanthomarina sp. F2636L]MCX7551570.1 nicotinic acid mononucleotide adenyltransferase [Xanthomarina sp. F2636L]
MKNMIMLFTFLISVGSFAQGRELKFNKNTNLIEVIYYHDNGLITQTGTYSLDGKLQGEWLSFNTAGEKAISANYDNGKKVGKWFYWNDKTLKEVDYNNNAIASVSEWTKKSASMHLN